MAATTEWVSAWAKDSRRFILDTYIEDFTNVERPMGALLPEQEPWLDALLNHRLVLGIKPRQLGWSTLTNAFLFWKAYTSKSPRQILSMVHHEDAVTRFRRMVDVMFENLPPELRVPLATSNEDTTEFGHNRAAIHRALAGGGGQGRSRTYNDTYFSEMGRYRSRTSANSSKDTPSTQNETFGSVLATVHDPTSHTIVESTGGGPFGLFYDLYQQACKPRSRWKLVFVPWTSVARYREELTPDAARDLLAELTPEEERLMRDYGVTPEQIAWRRFRMDELQFSELVMTREFPIVASDAFSASASTWFDDKALQYQEAFCQRKYEDHKTYRSPSPGMRYVISIDASGGTGGDETSIQVWGEDQVQCASSDSNRWSPREAAMVAARRSLEYGQGWQPPIFVEANGVGADVVEECESLGLNVWRDEKGRPFYSTGASSGNTKRKAYVHARDEIDNRRAIISDGYCIDQLRTIIEKPNGRIEAPGDKKIDPPVGHDDRADGAVIGLYGLRVMGYTSVQPVRDETAENTRRILEHQQRESNARRPYS